MYDGVSCNFFSITDDIYANHEQLMRLLEDSGNIQKENESFQELVEAYSSGALLEVSNEEANYWFDYENYKSTVFSEMNHLMIGVTEACNMRCKYCVYGGHYLTERTHGTKAMSEETLLKTIDYFWSISKSQHKVINFYGGEPFCSFIAIKRAVEYIHEEYGDDVEYYITTNGTLINEEVIDWFSEHKNVNLFVSIAGVKEDHNRLRVYQSGLPTYSDVYNNLKKIMEYDAVAFSDRVNIIFNIFDELQLKSINQLWREDQLFASISHLPEITFIDCVADDGYTKELYKMIVDKYKNCGFEPLSSYITCLKNGDYENLIVKFYNERFLRIHRRMNGDGRNILSGVCEPFKNKIFVDIEGRVHICENYLSGKMMGSINEEFSLENITWLLEKYKNVRNKMCKTCWANKLCSLCYKDVFDSEGNFDMEKVEHMCDAERASKLQIFKEYCTVLEQGEDLLNHLDGYWINE